MHIQGTLDFNIIGSLLSFFNSQCLRQQKFPNDLLNDLSKMIYHVLLLSSMQPFSPIEENIFEKSINSLRPQKELIGNRTV